VTQEVKIIKIADFYFYSHILLFIMLTPFRSMCYIPLNVYVCKDTHYNLFLNIKRTRKRTTFRNGI